MNDREWRAERARKKEQSTRRGRTTFRVIDVPEQVVTRVSGRLITCGDVCHPTHELRTRVASDVWQIRCLGGSNCSPTYDLDESARARTRLAFDIEPVKPEAPRERQDEEFLRLPTPRRVEGHIRHGHRRAA